MGEGIAAWQASGKVMLLFQGECDWPHAIGAFHVWGRYSGLSGLPSSLVRSPGLQTSEE